MHHVQFAVEEVQRLKELAGIVMSILHTQWPSMEQVVLHAACQQQGPNKIINYNNELCNVRLQQELSI